jgi:hypothetical protein
MDRLVDVRNYTTAWNVTPPDYDGPWVSRDGLHCPADSMRTRAYMAAWFQMRQHMPREQWSVEACDAIAESVLRTVRDWVEGTDRTPEE